MGVDSYLELFTTIYGWAFAAIIRDVLVATGIIYLPFIFLIVETWMEAHQSVAVDGADAAWMIRKMEIELGCAIFVMAMCFTTVPFLTLSQASLNYAPQPTVMNPAPAAVTGNTSNSTYTTAFGSVPGTVEVPPWWMTVMGLSAGFNQAVISGVGANSTGFRQLEEMVRMATVEDPVVRGQLQRFTNECWVPARSQYLAAQTPLGAAGAAAVSTYGETDTEWIGSHVFQVEPGYYDTLAAASGVPGFAVNATQDADVAQSAQPPQSGRPTCNQWWGALKGDALNALKVNGVSSVVNTLSTVVSNVVSVTQTDVDDAALRLAIARSRPTIVSPGQIVGDERAWYQQLTGAAFDVLGIAGAAGQTVAAQASKFPLIQFATMSQPLVLFGIYMFLPLIVVFSRYSLQVMFLGALAIFTVKFWAVMWFIARWLDDTLIKAMYPDAATLLGQLLQDGMDGTIKRISLNTLLVGLYIGLPLLWTGMMAWAGFRLTGGISRMTEMAINAGTTAGTNGVTKTTNLTRRS